LGHYILDREPTVSPLGRLDRTYGLSLGVNESVALASSAAGGELDSATVANPIVGFVFGQQELMVMTRSKAPR